MICKDENYPKLRQMANISDARGSMKILLEESAIRNSVIKMTSSTVGVLRGFHYQPAPFCQVKRIYVLEGKIQDVALEIDGDNIPTGNVFSSVIGAEDSTEILIPENWAHAYLTISESSKVLYVCDGEYGNEISFNPIKNFDGWLIEEKNLIISEKDMK
jgi:dTDP-4-dehydrorhamnose 3,5-epimerase